MGLAPAHDLVATEAGIGAQDQPHLRPGGPERRDDPLQLLPRAPGGVVVGGAELGRQQVLAAEDVPGQVAELLVVAVEEAALLVAVQGVVGGIQVGDEHRRRRGVGTEEEVHEPALDGLGPGDDLLVAAGGAGVGGRQFQAVEGTLAGQGLALVPGAQPVLAGGVGLADEGREQGVAAQGVLVVEVFVAQGQAVDALADELQDGVFEGVGVAVVGEAGGALAQRAGEALRLAPEQGTAVGGDGAAVEPGDDVALTQGLKREGGCVTRCWPEAVSAEESSGLLLKPLRSRRQPRFRPSVRNAG